MNAAWIALSLVRFLGGTRFRLLLERFGTPEGVLAAPDADLLALPGIGVKIVASIRAIDLPAFTRALAGWEAAGVRVVTTADDAYPALLRALPDAPPALFVRGALLPMPLRAIVGTREPSAAGRALAEQAAEQAGGVVSGLALGIDGIAHRAARYSVAVLGSGVLSVYPVEHTPLAAQVITRGALVSEVAPDERVTPPALVARNRLITALAHEVLVVETDVDGGAMHAARFARAQGRRLLVCDLPASGNQVLLREGAEVWGG